MLSTNGSTGLFTTNLFSLLPPPLCNYSVLPAEQEAGRELFRVRRVQSGEMSLYMLNTVEQKKIILGYL